MIDIPERIKTLKQYEPGKPIEIVELELGIKDSIKIASNENCIGPSPLAIEAIKNNLHKIHYYPDSDSYFLKKKLSDHFNLSRDKFVIGNGSNEIIEMVVRTLLDKNDEVIMSTPSFIVYPLIPHSAGIKYHQIPLTSDFEYDIENIISSINKNTKIIFFANPNNPTGTIVKNKDILKLLNIIDKKIFVLMDEAYFEYVDCEEFPDSISLQKDFPNIITLRSFSKIYGLAGLRIGYAITTPEIALYLNKAKQPFNVNMIAQIAATSALDDEKHVEDSKKTNTIGKDYLYQELSQIEHISYTKTYANFILIDIKAEALPIYKKLLHEGIIVRPMLNWGLPNHIRVTIGKDHENRLFINKLKKALA